MSKRLFAVVLTDEQDIGIRNIESAFAEADRCRVRDGVFVVAHTGLSRDVAIRAGIFEDTDTDEGNKPGDVSGVVLKLNGSYTGYANQAIWEWLGEAGKDIF